MTWYCRRSDRQAGPFSWERLVDAAAKGKLSPHDLVWSQGMKHWQAASTVPGLFSPEAVAAAGPPPQAAVSTLGEDPAMRWLLPVGRSGWAIAAGYLGLFSLLVLPAPFAVLCGILAIRDIRRDPTKHGMGRAVFGLVMGLLGTVGLLLILAAALST